MATATPAIMPMEATIYSLSPILLSCKSADEYLLEQNVFYDAIGCENCQEQMKRDIKGWRFRCTSRTCRTDKSLYSHTFFFGTKLKSNEILLLARLWLSKVHVNAAIELTGHSSATVVKFWSYFRELVSSTLLAEDDVIGGEAIIVEVDETKLGKRKYNRGHRVEGVWVVVGVERTKARKMFVVPVETRDSGALRAIIEKHVRPGSIIHTDLWRGYSWLKDSAKFHHMTVNHSIGFKDAETGVHTNYVEGTNNGIKQRIPVRSRVKNGIETHLAEFVWRRKHESKNIWDAFITAVRELHYDIK